MQFYNLNVLDTKTEIGGMAKSVMFEIPDELKSTFQYKPGQHLTLKFRLNGETVRRSYSISCSPYSGDALRITVKRVKSGLVSNHVNDNVNPGDEIEVMPAVGGFCLEPGTNLRRTHYFFASGSGITPVFSMLHSVLCHEPYSTVYLAYGNKDENSIIFKQKLAQLSDQYPHAMRVLYLLSENSVWSNFKFWRKGILDKSAIQALITENPPYAQDSHYYICGPGAMNTSVKSALMTLDVPLKRIHMESYGGAIEMDDSVKGIAATAQVKLKGDRHSLTIAADQTLLQAARRAGLSPPFSCLSGVCGTCRAKLLNGTVHMRARMALEDSEIDNGAILTCQSVATSENLTLEYD